MSAITIVRGGVGRRPRRVTLAALAALALAAGTAGTAVGAAPAVAATPGPVVAGLEITPAVTPVGGAVRVVGSATNTGATAVRASLGVDVPAGLRPTAVSGSACTPRNIVHLVYCGITALAPGQTATIAFTVTPSAAGSYPFRSYARITYTTDDTFAYATLTAG